MKFYNYLEEAAVKAKNYDKPIDINEYSKDQAIEYLKKNVGWKTTTLYRGIKKNIKGDALPDIMYFDSTKYKRTSAKTSANYYATMLDNLPSWNGYPKRNQAQICTTYIEKAKLYGKVYNVIPINNTIIVQCPQGDLQDSFVKVFNIPLNVFNDELNNVFKELQISADEFYNDPINILKSISVTDLDIDYFFYDKLINQIEKNKSMDNAFNIFNYYMSPTLNKFNLIKYGQKLATNKECWFSGPALLITPSEFEKIKKEL